jgi:hypothetical protein
MAKADTQKTKGDIWWQFARTFGQESNPTPWRLARMNPCVSNPKSADLVDCMVALSE